VTPLARVEAAILRLETERDAVSDIEFKKFLYYVGGTPSPFEALTLTLRSTVDPMLAILRDTLDLFRDPIPIFKGREEQVFAAQLALADSINGGTE